MISIFIILVLFLKLCSAQDYPYLISQEKDYSRTTNTLSDKTFNNFYDWKNNFDNNVIIPDAYVFNLYNMDFMNILNII